MATEKKDSKIWVQSNDNITIPVGMSDPSRHRSTLSHPADREALDRVVAERSMLIKNMLEDVGDDSISQENPIPIPNVRRYPAISASPTATALTFSSQVNEAVLRKVIDWCDHHRNDPIQTQDDENDARKKTTEIEEWDQKFMQVDQEMLFEIILV
ncbi:hypothetical protein LY78DRAFT_660676 [Colletotrichum sublineola]|nr:hypothetical protein LY78DRAFT_660676 [Colletotrichum sublineola]